LKGNATYILHFHQPATLLQLVELYGDITYKTRHAQCYILLFQLLEAVTVNKCHKH